MGQRHRSFGAALAAMSLAACSGLASAEQVTGRQASAGLVDIDVLHQAVEIAPFAGDGLLQGQQTIAFRVATEGDRLLFQGGPLNILSLRLDGQPIPDWTMADGEVDIALPSPVASGAEHSLDIVYETQPGRGVHRSDGLVYTTYFSCDWMVCDQADFDDRFTFDLTIRAPRGMTSLGPGDQTDVVASGSDDELHRWRTRDAFPAYVHAFAIGRLDRVDLSDGCATRLEVLSTAPPDRVNTIFAPTCAMLTYFEQRAGVAYAAERYSQLYDTGRWEAQEAISHSVLGGGAVDAVLTNPQEDWAVAHELAHQWWGNRVTAKTLSEFWLNEGLVTFMVAGWKEHRWGEAAYAREIALARGRWNRCRDDWRDVPIAYAGDYPSLAIRRCFQYSKAAVFLHELRATMGEDAFWNGIRGFTTANLGRSVTSPDFQAAMQRETAIDLGPTFAEWVYPAAERP